MSGSSLDRTARQVRLCISYSLRKDSHPAVNCASAMTDTPTTATLGISAYAANALGDVIYVELPQTGMEVGHGDAIGAVESVKSASDIMTPVSGKVVDANAKLEETPGLLNKSPEDEAWIAKIEVGDMEELNGLMDGEEYKNFTEEVDS